MANKKAEKKKVLLMKDTNNLSRGVFSNTVKISGNAREVFLDFGIVTPPLEQDTPEITQLISRIILTREHTEEFRDAMEKILKKKK